MAAAPALANTVDSDWLQMPDGALLYTKSWSSQQQPPAATVLFVHGVGEHIARYDHVFRAFSASGISVYGYDQRGSGRTGRRFDRGAVLGHGGGMEKTMEDVDEMLRRTETANIPQFLMGQSMGGCVVLNYAAKGKHRRCLTGVIATSPFLDFGTPQPQIKVAVLSAMAKLAPSFVIHSCIPSDDISRNAHVNRQYEADWLVNDLVSLQTSEWADGGDRFPVGTSAAPAFSQCRKPRTVPLRGTVSEAYRAGRKLVKENYRDVDVPLYLAHGTGDKITSYSATREFYENAKDITDITFDTYDEAYHELYNEPPPGAERCIKNIGRWILAKAEGAKSRSRH